MIVYKCLQINELNKYATFMNIMNLQYRSIFRILACKSFKSPIYYSKFFFGVQSLYSICLLKYIYRFKNNNVKANSTIELNLTVPEKWYFLSNPQKFLEKNSNFFYLQNEDLIFLCLHNGDIIMSIRYPF
jgi:hypothetical protein